VITTGSPASALAMQSAKWDLASATESRGTHDWNYGRNFRPPDSRSGIPQPNEAESAIGMRLKLLTA
jgi:hypothetical protein